MRRCCGTTDPGLMWTRAADVQTVQAHGSAPSSSLRLCLSAALPSFRTPRSSAAYMGTATAQKLVARSAAVWGSVWAQLKGRQSA